MIRGLFKVLTDPRQRRDWRFLTLIRITRMLYPSYRLQWPQLLWWEDQEFLSYLDKFGMRHSFEGDRRWMLNQLTKLVKSVPGDTAECGVWFGSSSYLMCKGLGRPHHMFDSWEGLSEPEEVDGPRFAKHEQASTEATVRANLAGFTNINFHKGWIPERFTDVKDRRFCFVHIDVQLAQPTRDSFEFFYPRMNPGGIIVSDDYGFNTCPGARKVIDEFLTDKPEKIMEMSCGSAFLVRSSH
jgi:hypothetical protein